jgi:uncharacterized protein (DUF2062 family)
MYYTSSSPYVLLAIGLFAGLTSGLAFGVTFKQLARQWVKMRSASALADLRGLRLLVPYLGISGGACLFLASVLEVFTFSRPVAYAIAAPLTLASAILVWWQLGIILKQVERGGVGAIDLSSLE